MSDTKIRDFTRGSIPRQLFSFAWPLFLSNLLQVVYNMIDMMIVGNVLGKSGLSAVSVGGDVSNFLTFVAMGFSNAGQVLIARYIGARERHKLGKFVGTMSSFLISCAVFLSVVGLLFQKEILQVMNTPPEALEGALHYSGVCMAAVINLVLDIVFVMGFGMGPGGAALATVISQAISFLTCAVFLTKNRQKFELNIGMREFLHWDKEMLSSLIKLGAPMAIKSASVQVTKLFVNSWINSYGVAVSAFAGIANKVASIANLISTAMNTAGSTMVGQNLAAKEYERVKKILKQLAILTLSVSTLMSVAVCLFPNEIFGIFTSESDVLVIAGGYVPIAVLVFYGSALRAVMNALINGSGNYKINFATAILDAIVLRIGLALLFGLALGMEHYGFWLGDALAGFTPFWIGLIFYFSGGWKKTGKAVA